MLTHYLRIAFRSMRKNRTQSIAGILGLAFGIACFIPAVYWMRYEATFDSNYPNSENIYRIFAIEKQSGKVNELIPGIVEKMLHEQLPATEASTGFIIEQDTYSTQKTPYIRLRTLCTDSTFFKVFPQVAISGDARHPMQVLHNIVLTESVATRLFGNAERAIGQQIRSTTFFFYPPYTITAVVKDSPANTNLPFDAILYSNIQNAPAKMPEETQWTFFNKQLYVKLHPQISADKFAEQLRDITSRLNVNADIELRMLPISDIRHRLAADLPFTMGFIWLFVASGALLMLSALFNFLSFHLSLFRQRMRELRQRSIVGASGNQLTIQLTFEVICTILLALLVAFCATILARPILSELLAIPIPLARLAYLFTICGASLLGLTLLIGLIPLWRLSRQAMQLLPDRRISQLVSLRRMAATVQLAVSVVLIVAALVAMMQMRFVNRTDLGFNSKGIIQLSGLLYTMEPEVRIALDDTLKSIPQIESFTASFFEPQHNTRAIVTDPEWPGKQPHEKIAFQCIGADSQFAETFRLKMREGSWWSEGEMQKIVLNEEAVRAMGLKNPVGSIISMYPDYVSDDGDEAMEQYEVVGVVNNFHTLSLRNHILPTIFMQSFEPEIIQYMRVSPGSEQEVIQQITAALPNIDASLADVRLTPLDELYSRLNHSEQVGLQLFSVMAIVCLLISLFGIYAVAFASTRNRRKEIAIRKVLGGEVKGILRMFFKEYLLLSVAACTVAFPIAGLAMVSWLQAYAYRTSIPWFLFVVVLAMVALLVLVAVLGQVLKAANGNPADVVKSE